MTKKIEFKYPTFIDGLVALGMVGVASILSLYLFQNGFIEAETCKQLVGGVFTGALLESFLKLE